MSRAQSVTSGEANDGVVEQEYAKLQRTFRVMDMERKAYAEQARQLINKQRSTIGTLTQENVSLAHDLSLADTNKNPSGTSAHKKQADQFHAQIKAASAQISQLNHEIENFNKAIASQRHAIGGVNASLVCSLAVDKHTKILENRLNQSLVKYNRALAGNKQYRSCIDNLRRDRVLFHSLFLKYNSELTELKKAMAEIIDASNSAYEARDDAQQKILVMSEKAAKEYQAYVQEIKELDRTLEQDRKLRTFLSTKAARESYKPESSHPEALPKSNIAQTSSQDMVSVASYEKVMDQIHQGTSVKSLDELVTRFTVAEHEIFSLFNYVNQVNNDVEKINDQVALINARVLGIHESGQKAHVDQKLLVSALETDLAATQAERARLHESTVQDESVITQLHATMDLLVTAFRTSNITVTTTIPVAQDEVDPVPVDDPVVSTPFAIPDMCVPAGASTADALVVYLGSIEHHVNQLLILHLLATANPRVKLTSAGTVPSSALTLRPVVQDPVLVQIQPPNTGDYDDSEDDADERPLSRSELAIKSIRGLSKRLQSGAAVPVPKRRRQANPATGNRRAVADK